MGMKRKARPYIDYKTAGILARMHDYILYANDANKFLAIELDRLVFNIGIADSKERMAGYVHIFQDTILRFYKPKLDPNKWTDAVGHEGIFDTVAKIRHSAWEMGLTETLFEKLKDRNFRNRFTGWLGNPVLEGEIVDRYFEKDEAIV